MKQWQWVDRIVMITQRCNFFNGLQILASHMNIDLRNIFPLKKNFLLLKGGEMLSSVPRYRQFKEIVTKKLDTLFGRL